MRSVVAPLLFGVVLSLSPGLAHATAGGHSSTDTLSDAIAATVVVHASGGIGAGVAVSTTEILTAAHVVDGAAVVSLITPTGSRSVEVMATDARRDLALLHAPGHGLPPAELRVERVRVGETVYAVGAPLGTHVQVTGGIVSALLTFGGVRQVQTDAAINPGNSGGPLLDAEGRLIGIVVTKSGDDEGIGWATAAADVDAFLTGLRASLPEPDASESGVGREVQRGGADPALALWLVASALVLGVALAAVATHRASRKRSPTPALVGAPAHVYPLLDLTTDLDLLAADGRRPPLTDRITRTPATQETTWTR